MFQQNSAEVGDYTPEEIEMMQKAEEARQQMQKELYEGLQREQQQRNERRNKAAEQL